MSKFNDIVKEHIGPPVNIEGIIRALGLELDKKAELDPEISGQIERVGDKYKISANVTDGYFRKRFTMAHELGHYIYHSDLLGEGADDDRKYRSVPDGKFYNTAIKKREETEANRFAASLLMPANLIRQEWARNPDVGVMVEKFKVSEPAMLIRLRGLDLEVPKPASLFDAAR